METWGRALTATGLLAGCGTALMPFLKFFGGVGSVSPFSLALREFRVAHACSAGCVQFRWDHACSTRFRQGNPPPLGPFGDGRLGGLGLLGDDGPGWLDPIVGVAIQRDALSLYVISTRS